MNKVFSEINPIDGQNRYEIKMLYDGLRYGEVISWINGHSQLFQKAYPSRQVNNIYFDTQDMAFKDAHDQGVFDRFKVRFRWYHKSWNTKKGQLEIKQKYGNLGKKKIFPILADIDLKSQSWEFIHNRIRSELNLETQLLFDTTRPVLINHYQRDYYINAEGIIRITLDKDHKIFDQGVGQKPNISYKLPVRNTLVLEYKTTSSHHQELSDVLEEFPLYSTAHSKYLIGTENTIT